MKGIKCLLACLLCVSILVSLVPPVFAMGTKETEGYQEQVYARYEKMIRERSLYPCLVRENDFCRFYYKDWADNMDSYGIIEKSVAWATNKMLNSDLSVDVYLKYLSALMVQIEQGNVDVLRKQTEFRQKVEREQNAIGLVLNVVLLDDEIRETAGDALELLYGAANPLKEIAFNTTEYEALSAVASIYETQMTVLRAIKNNTTDKDLKKAAELAMENYTYQFCFITERHLDDIEDLIKKGIKVSGVMEQISQKICQLTGTTFKDWVQEVLVANCGKKAAEAFMKNATWMISAVTYFKLGIQIGAGIMELCVGEQADMFREVVVMDRISDALILALKAAKDDAVRGDVAERYQDVCEFVAIGKGLIHTHNLGEYSDKLARKDYEDRTEFYMNYYYAFAGRMAAYEAQLNEILNAEFIVMTDRTDKENACYIVRAKVEGDSRYGLVDIRTGEMVVEPMFYSAEPSFGKDGFMLVAMDPEKTIYGLINDEGHFLFAPGSITGATEVYDGEYMVIEQDGRLFIYKDTNYMTEIELPDEMEHVEKTFAVGTYYASGAYNNAQHRSIDRFIPVTVFYQEGGTEKSVQYWYDHTGKLRYTAADRWGCLVEDSTGTYFLKRGYAEIVDRDGNVLAEMDYGVNDFQTVYPAVEYEGETWYAAHNHAVLTNGVTRSNINVLNMGYGYFELEDGVISRDGEFYTLDGEVIHSDLRALRASCYRNGYVKTRDGFADRYGTIVYAYDEDSYDNYSHALTDGHFVIKERLLGIYTMEGAEICSNVYTELYNMRADG